VKQFKTNFIFFLVPMLMLLLSTSIAEAAGISAGSSWVGGHFWNVLRSGHAWVATGDHGIEALGNSAGGVFTDTDSSSYAYVGNSTYKIQGTGAVSFVQNHPENDA